MYWLDTFEAFVTSRRTALAGAPALQITQRAQEYADQSREELHNPPSRRVVARKYLDDIFLGHERRIPEFQAFAKKYEQR